MLDYTGAVTPLSSAYDIPKARRVFQATRRLGFADIPAVDLKDRFSVLTIAAGLRPVGVLETWGQRLPRTRDLMISNGLATSVASCVWSEIERPEGTPHGAVLRALDQKRVAGKPKHVLWLYADEQCRKQFHRPSFTQQQAGTLLQYPPCCITFESGFMALLPQAQLEALLAEGHKDESVLLTAVHRSKQLASQKIALPDNALRTEQQFPFVMHVACDACLNHSESPSSKLNNTYGEFAREVDPGFYKLFLQVQATYQQVKKDASGNRDLFLQLRILHNSFFKTS